MTSPLQLAFTTDTETHSLLAFSPYSAFHTAPVYLSPIHSLGHTQGSMQHFRRLSSFFPLPGLIPLAMA